MDQVRVQLQSGAKSCTGIEIIVDRMCYPLEVVQRAIHALAPRWIGSIGCDGQDHFRVSFVADSAELHLHIEIERRFLILLNDFVLRERLEKETRTIRELIVRQAFDRTNLQFPALDIALPGQDPLSLSQPDAGTGRKHAD